ncbi:MAG: RNA polymerase sigma factor SigJ [Ramlibacter sp.]|nr:RNA polymerase sigma factor SigJ [Ramlibacter sp.]
MTNTAESLFEAQRPSLRALAYRMLGSRAEAEDLVQEAWLRWHAAPQEAIANPPAWLSKVMTHLCLDHMKSARNRREAYVGVWLPEPLVDSAMDFDPGPQARAEYAQEVSIAFMLALERLTPLERAAFLLHDVFDLDFPDVAARLGRNEAACRQLARRAREHVQAHHSRAEVAHQARSDLMAAFAQALHTGDADALATLLAEDACFLSDGGGKATAVSRPLHGALPVAKALAGFAKAWFGTDGQVRMTTVNGLPGAVLSLASGQVVQTMAFRIAPDARGQARIQTIYVTRNPDKLGFVSA